VKIPMLTWKRTISPAFRVLNQEASCVVFRQNKQCHCEAEGRGNPEAVAVSAGILTSLFAYRRIVPQDDIINPNAWKR